jgi:hypothetical protein
MKLAHRLAPLALLVSSLAALAAGPEEAAVARVLDDWHDAAAKADEPRYFAHFAKGGVFLGTDATERWDVESFRAYAHPYFAKGKAWSFHPKSRHVLFGKGGETAWFDELLDTPNLGEARGSGTLVKEDGAWRIALYDLSIPIPNDLAKEVVERISKARPRP